MNLKVSFLYIYFKMCYLGAITRELNVSYINDIQLVQNMFCQTNNPCINQQNSTQKFDIAIMDNIPVIPPFIPSSSCCAKCSCNVEQCNVRDSCCIEALKELWPRKDSKVIMSCEYPSLRRNDALPPVLMFRNCSKASNIEKDIINKCEQSDNFQDIETKIPVTDNTTMYTYINRFCAFCHNVTEIELHYWDVSLECENEILQPRNISSVVNEVLKTKGCDLIYKRPGYLKRGQFDKCHRKLISQCNVTGHWKTYNSFIEAACLAYYTIYNFKYKNVFCYLCNSNDFMARLKCDDIPQPSFTVDFIAILRFKPEITFSISDSKIHDICSKNQMYDPLQKQCRNIECLFPKTLQNGSCIYLVKYLGGMTFGIYLKLTPSKELKIDNDTSLHTVANDIKKELKVRLFKMITNVNRISFNVYSNKYHLSMENTFVIDDKISYFVAYVQMDCRLTHPVNSDIVDKLLSFHDTVLSSSILTYDKNKIEYKVEVDLYQTNLTAYDQTDKSLNDLNAILIDNITSNFPITVLSVHYICPSVRIYSNEFNIVRSTESIVIDEYSAIIKTNEVLLERLPDGINFSVRICSTLFEDILQQFSTNSELKKTTCLTETFNVKNILTLVCTTISICFSILTILVYLIFKKFASQPGINNIILCISLISAQSLYQFGSGQSCNVSKLSCQVLGVFVHFSWLFLMFWMNSCCIHMFRVFRLNQAMITAFNITKTTLLYAVYSFSCSLILILTNIIVSLIKSDWADIGYGGVLCYISQDYMVAYLFALPVAIIVVLNIILFTVVVLQMRTTSKVQNDENRQQFIYIYVKLSTITGSTWVFGFCSYFLNIAVLDYIFIILNASQGLFLFLAFVLNKRTLKSMQRRTTNE